MNEFYRTWEGKEIFCLFKEASGSYRQEGKGFVEGNENEIIYCHSVVP